jgi:hypothetical protein
MRMHASWFGSLRPTEYKVAARVPRAPTASSPRTRHPDHHQRAAVLKAVKAQPWKRRSWGGRSTRRPALTASCARRPPRCVGRGEETGFQIEQRNRSRKQEREIAALKPLDNEEPIQGMAWQGAEGVERLVRRPTLTAPARVGSCDTAGRGEETGFQIEQRNR